MKTNLKDTEGTQVTDIAKKVDYGTLVKPFKKGKKLKDFNETTSEQSEVSKLGGYVCTNCEKEISSDSDFANNCTCPFCKHKYNADEIEGLSFYETNITSSILNKLFESFKDDLKTTYEGKSGLKIKSNFEEPKVYEEKLSDNSLTKNLVKLNDFVFDSNLRSDISKNVKDFMDLASLLGRLSGSLESRKLISADDGQAVSDLGFAKSVYADDEILNVSKDELNKILSSMKSELGSNTDLIQYLDSIENILTKYLDKAE